MSKIKESDQESLRKWKTEALHEVEDRLQEMRPEFQELGLACAVALFHTPRSCIVLAAPVQDHFLLEREEGEYPAATCEIARRVKPVLGCPKIELMEGFPIQLQIQMRYHLEEIRRDPSAYRTNRQETESFLREAEEILFLFG